VTLKKRFNPRTGLSGVLSKPNTEMSGLIDRIQSRADARERPRVLGVDEGEADEVLDALASDTARRLYRGLFEEPATPSEIAARADTSIQNVNYHLGNLQEADLVEAVDTVYSEKGNEMTVYAPASDPLVFVGNRGIEPRVRSSITDVVGGVGLLAVASLCVQWGAERLAGGPGGVGVVGPASADGGVPMGSATWALFEVVEPGVAFFFACLLIAATVVAARNVSVSAA